MNCGFVLFFTYFILDGIYGKPSGMRQNSEIIFANSGNVRTSAPFELDDHAQSHSFPDGFDRRQSVVHQGRLSQGAARYPGTQYYSSQYLPNRYDPSREFSGPSSPFENSYRSGYPNHEYYPIADPCESGNYNRHYYPAQNTFHSGTPSYTTVNKPNFKGRSYDSGLNIWSSPNGMKASRTTGFDYKMDFKF